MNASKLESERLETINELLAQKAKGSHTLVKPAEQSEITKKDDENSGRNTPVEENQSTMDDRKGIERVPVLNDGLVPGLKPPSPAGKEFKPVCITKFREGVCHDRECQKLKWHKINMKKVERGMCAYKFGETGECPWGAKCMYTHDIPLEIWEDPAVRKNQIIKLKEVKKKQEGRIVPSAKSHIQPKSVESRTSGEKDGGGRTGRQKENQWQRGGPVIGQINYL